MPETMRGLWDRYRAASSAGVDSPESVGLRAALVRALAATGPVYAVGMTEAPVAWLGLGREDGGLLCIVGGAGRREPRDAPGVLRGEGMARDASGVMVPTLVARRDRERPL